MYMTLHAARTVVRRSFRNNIYNNYITIYHILFTVENYYYIIIFFITSFAITYLIISYCGKCTLLLVWSVSII